MSADTLTTDGLNRYAYVRGNPLRYNDPSGHCFVGADGQFVSANCSADDQYTWLNCASGLGCEQGSDLQRFAFVGVQQGVFADFFASSEESYLHDVRLYTATLRLYTHAARSPSAVHQFLSITVWGALAIHYNAGSPAYMEAAMWAAATGNTSHFDALTGNDIFGAREFWRDSNELNFALNLQVASDFGGIEHALDFSAAYDGFASSTIMLVRLMNAQVAKGLWSKDQHDLVRGTLGLEIPYAPETDPVDCWWNGCPTTGAPERGLYP